MADISHIHLYQHWPSGSMSGCVDLPVVVDIDITFELDGDSWMPVWGYEGNQLVVATDSEGAYVFVPAVVEESVL